MLVNTNGGDMIKRRDKIVIAALELLEEKGVLGLTTKNLAIKQEITEPALYRQFKNKHEIIVAMLDVLAAYDQQIMDTVKQNDMTTYEAVLYFITRYAELYQSYKALSTMIYSFDLYYYHEETQVKIMNILETRMSFLSSVLEEKRAKDHKYTSADLAERINDLLLVEVFKWRMSNATFDMKSLLIKKTIKLLGVEGIHEDISR